MQDSLRKVPFRCPECGFVQQEPATLLSTYCRSCGHHYKGGGQERSEKPALGAIPSLFKSRPRPPRAVHCYRCDKDHEVSASSRSTICPTCSTSIEFDDLVFSSNVSRPVDTRGKLQVTKKGNLTNAHLICGSAVIEGRLNGAMRCEGSVSLRCTGPLSARITADSVTIEKGCHLEMGFPMETRELRVYGSVAGRFSCSGRVHVFKGGRLDGVLFTPSITVDKGGTLLASTTIRPRTAITPDESA